MAKRLLAQERALADLLAQRDEPAVVGAVGKTAQGFDIDGLVVRVVGDPVEALAETRERPGQGTGRQCDARLAVGPQPRDLVEERRDGCRHQPLAVGVQVSLADGDEVAWRGVPAVRQQSVEAGFGEQPSHVGQDLLPVARRRVASDSRRRAAAGRAPGRVPARTTAPGRRSGSRS